jgi:hypothetical protein
MPTLRQDDLHDRLRVFVAKPTAQQLLQPLAGITGQLRTHGFPSATATASLTDNDAHSQPMHWPQIPHRAAT